MTEDLNASPCAPLRWGIERAHIVALFDDGGMETIHLVDLDVEEGREEALPEHEGGPVGSQMRYYCTLRPRGASPPDVWVGSDVNVAVVGTTTNGPTIVVGGRGLFGRVDDGVFEIEFGQPPRMTTWSEAEGTR